MLTKAVNELEKNQIILCYVFFLLKFGFLYSLSFSNSLLFTKEKKIHICIIDVSIDHFLVVLFHRVKYFFSFIVNRQEMILILSVFR